MRHLRQCFLVAALLIATVFVLIEWRGILLPIVIAVMVWYIINALSHGFRRVGIGRRHMPHWLALGSSTLIVFVGGIFLADLFVESAQVLATAAPSFENRLDGLVANVAASVGLKALPTSAQLVSDIDVSALAESAAGSLAAAFFDVILIVFYVLFLLAQQRYMPRKMDLIVADPSRRQRLEGIIDRIQHDIQRYILVMVIQAVIIGVLTYVVLTLVGVEFAALWSMVVALLSFLSTIGTVIGIALPALITLLQFGTLTPFLIVLASLAVMQILVSNLIQPAMMGKSLNLSPFVVLVALAVWTTIWGAAGAVLSVPITIAAVIIMANVPSLRPVAILLSLDGEVK